MAGMRLLTLRRGLLATFFLAFAAAAGAAAVTTDYLSFDGINDVVSVPNSASLRPSQRITVEAWIRPRTISSNTNQDRIISKGERC